MRLTSLQHQQHRHLCRRRCVNPSLVLFPGFQSPALAALAALAALLAIYVLVDLVLRSKFPPLLGVLLVSCLLWVLILRGAYLLVLLLLPLLS